MAVKLDFVKGHCGWDVMTLIPEGQAPAANELATSIKIVSPPIDGGLEVGWLGVTGQPGVFRLRMVNSTTRDWIAMCGGMSQVIGKALVETFLRDRFSVDVTRELLEITLLTPCGEIPVRVDVRNRKAVGVTTTMNAYVDYLYRGGIERLELQGTEVLRVGDYAVINVRDLEAAHSGIDFTRRDFGPHLDIVNGILRQFRQLLGLNGVNGMLYDDRPAGLADYRVFPRFYSDDLAAARVPWEFQCGTGSIAVAVALAEEGKLASVAESGAVRLEWGNHSVTPDPYGIRTSRLSFELNGRRLTGIAFSHSVIEILAEGTLTLPTYTV